MPNDMIQLINQMGIDDGSPEEGIVFRNIHHELTVELMYRDVDPDDNSDNASDTSWDDKKHGDVQNDDKNILNRNHDDVEDTEVKDLMEDQLQLQSGFGENINDANNELQYLQEGGILHKAEGQGNHFNNVNNIPLANNVPPGQDDHFEGPNNGNNDDDINGNNDKNQNINENEPNQVSENDDGSMETYDDCEYDNALEVNNENNHYSEDEKVMIITLMNLKLMIKIEMILINMKDLQDEKEEETDIVVIMPYQEERAS